MQSLQRIFFDEVILPQSIKGAKSCLFIGVDWYNQYIWKKYDEVDWITLDANEDNSKYGSFNHKTVELPLYSSTFFEGKKFDVIYFNGVYGWGLNNCKDLNSTFYQLQSLLNDKGRIIFGYNDTPERNPCGIKIFDKCEFIEVDEACPYLPNGSFIFMNSSRHRYVVYRRK